MVLDAGLHHRLITVLLQVVPATARGRLSFAGDAFGPSHPLLNKLQWEGPQTEFLTHLIDTLWAHGDITPNTPALCMLLRNIKLGVNWQPEIDALDRSVYIASHAGQMNVRFGPVVTNATVPTNTHPTNASPPGNPPKTTAPMDPDDWENKSRGKKGLFGRILDDKTE